MWGDDQGYQPKQGIGFLLREWWREILWTGFWITSLSILGTMLSLYMLQLFFSILGE